MEVSKVAVENKSAMVAESKSNVFRGNGHCFLIVLDGDQAVNRGILNREEIFNIGMCAIWACVCVSWNLLILK